MRADLARRLWRALTSRRLWRAVGAAQPSALGCLLLAPNVLYAYLQHHCGWLSVWSPW